jgi:hypothetical protein
VTAAPRRLAAALAAVVATAVLAACGVAADGAPRQIATEAMPAQIGGGETTTTTTLPPATGYEEKVWVVQGETTPRLHPITVRVAPGDPALVARELLTELIRQRGDALSTEPVPNLRNRIPLETEVLNTTLLDDGVLLIDFNNKLADGIEGEGLVQAMAQIVFTATEVAGVNSVRIRIGDIDQAVQLEKGVNRPVLQPVFRIDYPEFNQAVESLGTSAGAG